jgi:hypothetical protein
LAQGKTASISTLRYANTSLRSNKAQPYSQGTLFVRSFGKYNRVDTANFLPLGGRALPPLWGNSAYSICNRLKLGKHLPA